MYLSKILLDIRHPSVRQALRDCEDLHRNVQKWFCDSRKNSGVLYRLRVSDRECAVYTFSVEPPVVDGRVASLAGSREMTFMKEKMNAGASLHFELLAVPSKKVSDEISKNSKRQYLCIPDEQENWIKRKAERGGFEILSLQILPGPTAYSKHKNMSFPSVHYSGMLRITDPAKFRETWQTGIGPEKAYGYGMLLVR